MNIQYYDLRSNQLQLKDEQKEWDARKEFEKKKPVKRQSWSTVQWHASTRPSAAGHGSKPEWTCYSWPSLARVFMTSCRRFSPRKESPCCLCPLPIASRWSVTVSALCRRVPNWSRNAFFRCLFRVANSCAVFFFKPQANDVPSTTHGKRGTVSVKYTCAFSPLWLLRVTGNCFWFLDRPPVSKGLRLMCSSSLHLLLVFVLVVRRIAPLLEIYFFTDSVHADSLRYDRFAWTVGFWNFFNRQILEIPTDESLRKNCLILEKLTCSK